jgi:predicted aldo/keto reductase-like oxidoreductase
MASAPAFLLDPGCGPGIRSLLVEHGGSIPDDSLIKLFRQLEFWHGQGSLGAGEMMALAKRLVGAATWLSRSQQSDPAANSTSTSTSTSTSSPRRLKSRPAFRVPRVRFGRTGLSIPVVTCGGMRLQQTWLPDVVPLLSPSRSKVLASASQKNLLNVVRTCLAVGLNHFETARFYGTSEMQFVDALSTLIESGEVRREDFVFQTKVQPKATGGEFLATWAASWRHLGEKLGYVDLLSFHGVSDDQEVGWVLDGSESGCYAAAAGLIKDDKVRHLGFSTHGTASNVYKLVDSGKFEYVNLHYHFFGSYHAEGTADPLGGHGNIAAVRRARELDMGVFIISPFDKGGKLYQPSARVARAVGPALTPIAFAALHCWKTAGAHTVSVGIARPSDLDEVLEAAAVFARGDFGELQAAEKRLAELAEGRVGTDRVRRGLLGLPTCYDEPTAGQALGHMLWLHGLMKAYGMYDFCRDRYNMLEGCSWNRRKSFEANIAKMRSFNPGRSYDAGVDLAEALREHPFEEDGVRSRLAEVHGWLTKESADLTEAERRERGWERAYDLTVWTEYPGNPTVSGVLLQNLTGGRMGITGTGPSIKSSAEAISLRYMSLSEFESAEEEKSDR